MRVTIPSCKEHEGFYEMTIEISDLCPVCGGPRGEPTQGLSYDGSRRLNVSVWSNPCGHIDYYWKVRDEYQKAKISQNELTAPATDTGDK
ncbi:hypothetical protein ACE38W_14735 [Chitinophaga sp. Hz27]|uniref:hypothetical protein n=1 Tax=Chitinophaga sp. Hz27 TaxID=3347169 RepID=UPI0035D92266